MGRYINASSVSLSSKSCNLESFQSCLVEPEKILDPIKAPETVTLLLLVGAFPSCGLFLGDFLFLIYTFRR